MRLLVVLALGIYGCSQPELTLTEQDAIALNFVRVECPDVADVGVYVEKERPQAGDEGCMEARFALAQARDGTLVPTAALAGDSIVAAVVSWVRYAASVPVDPEQVVEGVHVTLELAGRDLNILVVASPLERTVEFVPKGLRY